MVQSVVTIILVLLGISLLPAAMLWGFLKLVDYAADEEKLAEIQRARREDRRSDFSTETGGTGLRIEPPDGDDDSENDPDDGPREPDRSPSASTAERTVACPSCGRENDARFDRCWNCVSEL